MATATLNTRATKALPAMTRPQKAAVIIGALGAAGAAGVLRDLGPDGLRAFAGAMSSLRHVARETVDATICEFLSELEAGGTEISGGLARVRDMLRDSLGENAAAQLLSELSGQPDRDIWSELASTPPRKLALRLAAENPRIAAVILSKLPAQAAAETLSRMPPEASQQAAMAIAGTRNLPEDVITEIGRALADSIVAERAASSFAHPPDARLGAIMNHAPAQLREQVLAGLDSTSPELAAQVRRRLLTFADLPARLNPRDISAALRAVPEDVLLPALAGAADSAPQVLDFILSGISARLADQLRDQITEAPPMSPPDADRAQRALVAVIRDLAQSGEISLIKTEGAEDDDAD